MHDSAGEVQRLGVAFAAGLRDILGEKLVAAYLCGAAAFPGSWPLRDVDFHVILAGALNAQERAALEAMHEGLAAQHPPLGGEMDGYYVQLQDARGDAPPRSEMWGHAVDYAWALHRAHLLAGRCVVLHGPKPEAIWRPPSWAEIEAAVGSYAGAPSDEGRQRLEREVEQFLAFAGARIERERRGEAAEA